MKEGHSDLDMKMKGSLDLKELNTVPKIITVFNEKKIFKVNIILIYSCVKF